MKINASTLSDPVSIEALDTRIIATMRLLLALSGLVIIAIDPAEPNRYVVATYTTLTLYSIYSAGLYVLALCRHRFLIMIIPWAHWADVAWYTLLISLSNGTNSVFFFGFLFAILVASFRWGLVTGLRVTIVSVLLFTTVGYATAPGGQQFQLNRFLLRPTYLLVLGYMIAYWGGFEITLKRRLALLKEVTRLSNPRFGVDRTIGWLMERLRSFYQADICLLVTASLPAGNYQLRRANSKDPEKAMHVELIPESLAKQLLTLPKDCAIIYSQQNRWRLWRLDYSAYNTTTGQRTAEGQEPSATIAVTLDAASFVSVPFQRRSETVGRLYLTAQRPSAFERSDADFLLQVLEHVTPVIENIRLVDHLASQAAEEERQRIARDLHDSIIQPYIGLRMGLAALRNKLRTGTANLSSDVEQLLSLTDEGITNLRAYTSDLKSPGVEGNTLLPAVQRFATKFSKATGIDVHVEVAADIDISDRLAAEVFQIIIEGLSNIRRHTQAARAFIYLDRRDNNVLLRIENEAGEIVPVAFFMPRSISERAAALGGETHVEQRDDGGVAVIVGIPL